MMLVVADTTPLRYLVEIDCQHVLCVLFARVLIPAAVLGELIRQQTPAVVRIWAGQLPSWAEVRELSAPPDETLIAELDRGEREAIQLAHELGVKVLLIDERDGARIAQQRGFAIMGTLGILVEGAEMGLLSLDESLTRLARTNFRRTPQLFEQIRKLAANRRRNRE
jgi:predicted nucleic acid-binding protein